MKKYTNAWLKTNSNNHDCANDDICGQSITDFRIGNSDISFYDNYGRTIAQIPNLPNGSSAKSYNNLYKIAESRNFSKNTKYVGLQDVLPNQFNFEYGKLNCVIHYDNVSQWEKDQIKLDIQNAYEAYKAKFCINSDTQVTVHTYIFNNGDDYRRHGTLVPRISQSALDTSLGMTNGESILIYKSTAADNTLAHEFGHVFQSEFSPTKVRELDFANSELMANAIGLEVAEKNYKAFSIYKQMGLDDYIEFTGALHIKYKGTNYDVHHNGYLSAEEEKLQFIKDIKNSHESLVSECDGLGNENTVLSIHVDENKEISQMYFHNPDKNISKWLDKTLISRGKPEQDVDDTAGKEPEPESAEEDTQQPSNFLSNIFSTIKSIIDSISSLFSWLFGSKEEKSDESTQQPSADDLSLLKPDMDKLGHDVRDHLSDNYNHYNSSDGL